MGTVHAKEAAETAEKSTLRVSADQVKARVDKVHIDGLARTKDDVITKAVQELFRVDNFHQVLVQAHAVRRQLESLGAFKNISIFIDTSKGENSTPDGLEVTYHVMESRRLVGGVNTLVGNNEGSLVIGVKMPNLLGRGESIQGEYQYGTKKSSGFNVTFSKPLLGYINPRFTAAAFQQGMDFVWSGFHEINRGMLLELMFERSPHIRHNLRWEGIWRDLKCLSQSTAFPVREEMGHSLKSSLKHILTVDKRDNSVLPNFGTYFRLTQEYAGLGGNVGFLKHEVEYQVNQAIVDGVVIQGSLMAGLMRGRDQPEKRFNISDRFFLGGPMSLRGFTMRGAGPHADDNALGAEGYWAGGLHLYTPLPFRPGKGGFGDYFRTHFFLNVGNIDKFRFSDDYYQSLVMLLTNLRFSYGGGIVLSLGHMARFELNYCIPLKYQIGDRINPGLQFGIGVTFL